MSNDIERDGFEKSARHILRCQPAEFKKISDGSYFHESTYRLFMMWQAAKQSEWQPIETFPKDQEILILSNLNNRYVGIWAKNVYTGDEGFIIGNDNNGNQMIVEFKNIKKWCELPQPPKEQS